ncbi:SMP-30/gluconolactonase/LRE family protein [Robiginitomaculum antarcticum]|uniref:SMP-30/gluconolactonase/LRE family protein n=1 Tax=Robiginitomaculum antarcticum TaxID=437507 RepID=UPI0003672310|nr:SMP-30/gluconolactonase/LRE family protein [Robiginitomaculum antarcticum]
MLRFILRALGVIFILAILGFAYLAFWPVPISPQAWDAPEDAGYTGDFLSNTKLATFETISLGDYPGPEDVVIIDGAVYAASHTGAITKIDFDAKAVAKIADTGGKPLGMEPARDGGVYVADAYKGLIHVAMDGKVTTLTDSVDGTPIAYADDLDIGADGTIYFSDASTKFGAQAVGSTMDASLLEIMEQGRTGRLLAYNPADQSTRVVAEGFSFSNGVAMEPPHSDGRESVLMTETGRYRVLRVWVSGPRAGQHDVIIDNLPGFPDNINRADNGTYWLGLISPRSKWLDDNSAKPKARAMAMRLPASMRPKAENYGHIVRITAVGEVLETRQDPDGAYPQITGAFVGGDGYLYLTSLTAPDLARVKE